MTMSLYVYRYECHTLGGAGEGMHQASPDFRQVCNGTGYVSGHPSQSRGD